MDDFSINSGSTKHRMHFSRYELFDIIRSSEPIKMEDKLEHLRLALKEKTGCPENKVTELNQALTGFIFHFKKKWADSKRTSNRFASQNKEWLEGTIELTNYKFVNVKRGVAGRPSQDFADCSERAKRKKTEHVRKSMTTEELTFATQMSLRASGELDSAKLLKDITSTTPTRPKKYRDAYQHFSECQSEKMPGEEALAMLVDAKLTRHQYNIIRSKDKRRFPSYKIIQEAKKECYPNAEDIFITESAAEVKLQALLNHTVTRLLRAQEDVLKTLSAKEQQNLLLVSKWGFNGSSGHSEYKQQAEKDEFSDSSVFLTSLVPIQLICPKGSGKNIIVWQNPRPSSTRYCRPLKFQFVKETEAVVAGEESSMNKQIEDLDPSFYTCDSVDAKVKHQLRLTMVDGKICNYLTQTRSTQKCVLCGLTSKNFNDLNTIDNAEITISAMNFGLSLLHGWIRLFESLLHLSYKLPLKQWRARGEGKEIVRKKRERIQKELRRQIGIIVDKPKPGFGNSNDGNTARKFFENYQASSSITGVEQQIIYRYGVIMKTLSSGFEIELNNFRKYCRQTLELYIQLYPWYPMPTSVHKILCHGCDIIQHHGFLPIGQLSEEAQEARNKEFKQFRRDFSRRTSRIATNEDVLHSLLVSSDPYVSSIRPLPRKNIKHFSSDVLGMLKAPDNRTSSFQNSSEDEASTDEECN